MMNRRTLLKGLAAASIYGSAGRSGALSALAQPQSGVTLNVVLHGLFAMQFTKTNIQLIAPYVSMHRYLAGSWDPNDLHAMCPENQPFTLTGTPKLPAYDPGNLNRGLVLSMKQLNFNVDLEHAYVTTSLPWPQDIRLLRFAKPDPVTGGAKIFADQPLDTVTELSLCQVLIYPNVDLNTLGLTGTQWRRKAPSSAKTVKAKTVNLHIWAEPQRTINLPSHAVEAYQQLGKLLPKLSFKLATADIKGDRDRDTKVPGMDPEEEKGLSEWLAWGEGTSGSDCACAVVIP